MQPRTKYLIRLTVVVVVLGLFITSVIYLLVPPPRQLLGKSLGRHQRQPTRAYLPGTLSTSIMTHEIGHNLDFSHANFLFCNQSMTTNQPVYTSSCISQEYGDPFDVMGNHSDNYRTINAPHRVQVISPQPKTPEYPLACASCSNLAMRTYIPCGSNSPLR